MPPIDLDAQRRLALKIVDILVRQSGGETSEGLRRAFPLARQSFYYGLAYGKREGWFIGGGQNQPYTLSPNGSWRDLLASAGEQQLEKDQLDKDRLEFLVDKQAVEIEELRDELSRFSDANGAGVAVGALVAIVVDGNATPRQRIRAASTVLSYRTEDDDAVGLARKYLQSACGDLGVAVDYRIEASEALRRSEDAKLVPPTERPARTAPAEPKPIPLRELIAMRKAKHEAAVREQMLQALKPGLGNGGGDD